MTPEDVQSATKDSATKRKRVREYIAKRGLSGVVITTREHFAWISSGGDNHVVYPTSIGFGSIVITKDKQYLVAHSMDADRLIEEQINGQEYELVTMHWYEGDIRAKAVELAGSRAGSDSVFPGTENIYMDLVDLHYPMTHLEVKRTRWLAKVTDDLFSTIGRAVQPGEREVDIAAKLWNMHNSIGLEIDGIIVGSDERCFKYRHPIATEKPLEKYLMLHSVARKWGLHCNLTRFVHFGPPADEVRKVYDCAANVEARVFQMIKPGIRFADILKNQKKWYSDSGYDDEWKYHFQGGPTGYVIADGGRSLTEKVVQVNQPFEWFITVTGTKTGELSLLTAEGLEISSFINSSWPGMHVDTRSGGIVVPDILVR